MARRTWSSGNEIRPPFCSFESPACQQYVSSINRNSKRVIYVFPCPPIMAHLSRGNIARALFRSSVPTQSQSVRQAVSELSSFEY